MRLLYDPETDLAGKHILLVEDIVDSGNTLNALKLLLVGRKPASLDVCTLLHKGIANNLELEPHFVGFEAPNKFLVGYGLDHAEEYRHLPFVAVMKD